MKNEKKTQKVALVHAVQNEVLCVQGGADLTVLVDGLFFGSFSLAGNPSVRFDAKRTFPIHETDGSNADDASRDAGAGQVLSSIRGCLAPVRSCVGQRAELYGEWSITSISWCHCSRASYDDFR